MFIYNVAIALKENELTSLPFWAELDESSEKRKVNSWANSSITWQNSMVRNHTGCANTHHTWNKSYGTPLYVTFYANIQLKDKFPFRWMLTRPIHFFFYKILKWQGNEVIQDQRGSLHYRYRFTPAALWEMYSTPVHFSHVGGKGEREKEREKAGEEMVVRGWQTDSVGVVHRCSGNHR